MVAIAPEKADALIASLRKLEAQGLRFIIEKSDEPTPIAGRTLRLRAGRPRQARHNPGHNARPRRTKRQHRRTRSQCVRAPFSGEAMFKAKARLTLPDDLHLEELRQSLEALAHELMVDLSLDDNSALVHCG